jgi:hypothetical protein
MNVRSDNGTRLVWVNTNPRGRVHELDCRWLAAVLNKRSDARPYEQMPANQEPAKSRTHCRHC